MIAKSDDKSRDGALGAVLAEPVFSSDPAFTASVMALVDADRRLAAVRKRAWQSFAVESVAVGAIALALLTLAQLSGTGNVLPSGPALAGVLAILAWLGLSHGPRALA